MTRLKIEELRAAIARLGAPLASVMAVVEVESGGGWTLDLRRGVLESDGRGGGFLSDGRCRILYEPHVAWRVTGGAWGEVYPISARAWGTWPYGSLAEQWRRHGLAAERSSSVAVQACSWGLFQLLGEGWRGLGYASPGAFRAAMEQSEGAQLEGFCRFIETRGLVAALRAGGQLADSWREFARRYNGPRFADHDYHGRLARARARYAALDPAEALYRGLLALGDERQREF